MTDDPKVSKSTTQHPHGGVAPTPRIVGIGASAGGLKALIALLESLPEDLGMAFVIIQHLDPTRPSSLVEILGKKTKLPIEQLESDTVVQRDHVYVIAPGRYLSLSDGRLSVTEPLAPRGYRTPIDFFFRSLAVSSADMAIGVLLSGTGTDGTIGLREIQSGGGLTIVQNPDEADQPGMLNSAIRGGYVELILPVKEIGTALKEYVDFFDQRSPTSNKAGSLELNPLISTILEMLGQEFNEDFSRYRTNTIERRVHRRMGLRKIRSLADYINLLLSDVTEFKKLRRDLLIGVTRFFRDQRAWLQLQEELLKKLEHFDGERPFRVWSVGCASGEEAYSLAMLLYEQTRKLKTPISFQVFASDIAEDSLQFARSGFYPESISHDITADRLQRFFIKEQSGYRVAKFLRDSVLFANHNLLTQAPFYNIDLISCRNLLIYLNRSAQNLVFDIFQFALNEGGILMLGKTESVGKGADLFEVISQTHRLFRRTDVNRSFPIGKIFKVPNRPTLPNTTVVRPEEGSDSGLVGCVQRQVLRQLEHAVAVVNQSGKLIFVEGRTDHFLKLPSGLLTAELPDLMAVIRRGMKEKLRQTLAKAWSTREKVTIEGQVQRSGGYHSCRIQISHLAGRPADRPALLLTFSPLNQNAVHAVTTEDQSRTSQDLAGSFAQSTVLELEQELAITRDQLNGSVAELESSNEQLKALNEEAMTMNEELQSSNEELETSKEELESLNEELSTLNQQLESKVGELEQSTDDLENFIRSSDVPTLFLDLEFRIRRFTPSFAKVCNFLVGDIGRPLADMRLPLEDPNLITDAQNVLHELQPREEFIFYSSKNRVLRRRILPYRTGSNRIEGVIVTLHDVSELAEAQRKAEDELAQNLLLYSTTPVGLAYLDEKLRVQRINELLAQICDATVEDCLGKSFDAVFPAALVASIREHHRGALTLGNCVHDVAFSIADKYMAASQPEASLAHADYQRHFLASYELRKDSKDNVLGINLVIQEVTELKLAELKLAASNRELEHAKRRLEAAQQAGRVGSWEWNCQSDEVVWSESFTKMLGYSRDEFPTTIGEFWEIVHPDDLEQSQALANAVSTGAASVYEGEFRLRRKSNDYIWFSSRGLPVLDKEGQMTRLVGAAIDITERKLVEDKKTCVWSP